jgi:hypothetical protein
MKPNIFKYATSELSQDAFICWLLAWAKDENKSINPKLHNLGIKFLKSLFEICKEKFPPNLNRIRIEKQYKRIDVLCMVNGQYALIIEDKTNTKNHFGQLERYVNIVKEDFKSHKILPIYFKTGDQSNYDDVEANGYMPYLREDFMKVLNQGKDLKIEDSIFRDYLELISELDNRRRNYLRFELKEIIDNIRNHDAWIGFFMHLKGELKTGDWDYVSNPSGGFMGYWWNFMGDDKLKIYCQLEYNCFVFKLNVDKKEEQKAIRNLVDSQIKDSYVINGKVVKVKRPSRKATGQYMTLCKVEGSYLVYDSGALHLNETIENIRDYSLIVSEIFNKITSE